MRESAEKNLPAWEEGQGFKEDIHLLDAPGRWILFPAQKLVRFANRGLSIWRIINFLSRWFPGWSHYPVVGPDGKKFHVDLKGKGFAQVSMGWRVSEILPSLAVLDRKSVAIDIGANAGVWSRTLGMCFVQGHVYAWEPSPQTFRILKMNTAEFPNITAVQLAAGSGEGTVNFSGLEVEPGLRSIEKFRTESTVQVEMSTLDSWVEKEGIRRLDFLKIDVEGCEEDVIFGAERVLERFKPTICFEYIEAMAKDRAMRTGTTLFSSLYNLGYTIYRLDKSGVSSVDFEKAAEWTNDYLAVVEKK